MCFLLLENNLGRTIVFVNDFWLFYNAFVIVYSLEK